MQAIQSRARLVEPAAAAPVERPALPIRRAAAEDVLRDGDGPVELTFDVVRVGGTTEAISMILERPDLERTLQSADGDELALIFDPDELERAIEGSEVEAQGLRETAAVLTVAVAAMAGHAGVASAAGGASGTGYVVPAAGGAAIVNDAGAAGGASGTGYVVPAGSDQAIVNDAGAAGASGTGYVIPAGGTEAIVNDAGAAGGASGTGYVVPAGSDQAIVNDAGAAGASGTGYVIPAGGTEAIVNDAGAAGDASGTGYVVPAGSDQAIVRRRRGRCERHRLCHPGRWHGGDRQRRRRNEYDARRLLETVPRYRQRRPLQSGQARYCSSPAPPSQQRRRSGARTRPTSLLRSEGARCAAASPAAHQVLQRSRAVFSRDASLVRPCLAALDCMRGRVLRWPRTVIARSRC